jgi:catechol 2,3-dioxygenase-like lactoylglutathione lyase family enzyme
MTQGIHHTGFTVRDLERSIAFYRDLLGMAVVSCRAEATAPYLAQVTGYEKVRLRIALLRPAPACAGLLELIEYVEPAGVPVDTRTLNPGTAHLCVVTDDLAGLHRRLSDAGVPCCSEPVPLPTGPNAGGWSVYCTDPDGITVELFQPPLVASDAV